MISIFKIFQDLKNKIPSKIDGFTIANLPKIKNHKIGLSKDGLPLFFIKCENETNEKALDYNLESISIQFNQKCQLLSNDKKIRIASIKANYGWYSIYKYRELHKNSKIEKEYIGYLKTFNSTKNLKKLNATLEEV